MSFRKKTHYDSERMVVETLGKFSYQKVLQNAIKGIFAKALTESATAILRVYDWSIYTFDNKRHLLYVLHNLGKMLTGR